MYSAQLLDELPMILGTLVFIYIVLDFQLPGASVISSKSFPNTMNISKEQKNKILIAALLCYGFLTCVIMAMFTDSPVPMNLSYAFMVAFLVIRATSIFWTSKENPIKFLFKVAFVTYMSGATFWIVEKNFCKQLPSAEYFHVAWHLLAGFGTYTFITFTQVVHAYSLGFRPKVDYFWGFVPYISYLTK